MDDDQSIDAKALAIHMLLFALFGCEKCEEKTVGEVIEHLEFFFTEEEMQAAKNYLDPLNYDT